MNILPYVIGPVIAVLIVSTIMSAVYKNKEKKDKGFVLSYHRLTYRRRLIRAVWGIPIVALLYFALYKLSVLSSNEYKIIGIIFLFSILLDIGYNYVKWKKNEKKRQLISKLLKVPGRSFNAPKLFYEEFNAYEVKDIIVVLITGVGSGI